jgi:uncharacterized membrane protein
MNPTAVSTPVSTGPVNDRASTVLKWGFRFSAFLLAVGIAVTLLRGDDISTDAVRLVDIIPGVLDGDGDAIVTLSIVSMIVTPVLATLVVALGFFALGDRRFGRLSLAVLAVLAISIVAAFVRQ